MAAKKKIPDKKQQKKGGKKGEKTDPVPEEEEEMSVLDKEYYTTQIQALERTVERTTHMCDLLSAAEEHARQKYQSLQQEKVDIVAFLRETLNSRDNEIDDLQCRLAGLVQARQTERESYEEQLKKLRTQLEETRAELSDQILSLTRKLESLEEFRIHKDELEKEHKDLKEQLEKERKEHREKMSTMERSYLEENEAFKTSQEEKIKKISEELRKGAKAEMHATTRSAILENESLNQALNALKTRVTKLRQENTELKNQMSELEIKKNTLRDSLGYITKVADRRLTVLHQVTAKAEQNCKMYQDYDQLVQDKDNLRRDVQQLQGQLDIATKVSTDLRENINEKNVALELVSLRLQDEKVERGKLSETLQAGLHLIQESIFQDDKRKSEATADSQVFWLLMRQLVEILSQGELVSLQPKQNSQVVVEGTERKSESMITYSPGDLGLMPRYQKPS